MIVTVLHLTVIGAILMYLRSRMTDWRWAATVAALCLILGAVQLYQADPTGAGFSGGWGTVWAWLAWRDWKNRPPRNRKKVLRALGNKAQARLEAMKKAMPRVRVLRPLPA